MTTGQYVLLVSCSNRNSGQEDREHVLLWIVLRKGESMKMYVKSSTNSSLLAVFWVTPDGVVGECDTLKGSNSEQFGRYIQLDIDHFQIWSQYQNQGMYVDTEYDYYPRGRVLFDTRIHKFIVVGDKQFVGNANLQSIIRKEYGLPITTVFETDEHYTSEYQL